MEFKIEELKKRHSVRNYLTDAIPEELRRQLDADVTMINSQQAGLNFRLVYDDPDPLKGFRKSYGMFHNARNYLAAVIDPTFDHAEERAGYFAEQFVMGAVKRDLGTCFISGTYSAKDVKVRMEVYERLAFIVAFGFPAEKPQTGLSRLMAKAVHGKSVAPRDFFDGNDDEYAAAKELMPWIETGLEGLMCAPSAMNRQEIRIGLTEVDGRKCLEAHSIKAPQPIDLGIAKFNFQAPLPVEGEWQRGEHGIFEITED